MSRSIHVPSVWTEAETPEARLETDSRVIVLDKHGILHSSYKRAADNTLAEAQKIVRSMSLLARGKRRPVLVDFRGMRSMDREARAYFAGPETAAVISAAAILVDSSLEMAIGNFFASTKESLVPMRVFTSESDAIAWLMTIPRRPSRRLEAQREGGPDRKSSRKMPIAAVGEGARSSPWYSNRIE